MAYEAIKVIAADAEDPNHNVNRVTDFDETPLSNKICYRDGLPYMTATPKSLGGKGPRRVDLNGIFYLFSNNLFELQQGFYPTYNAAVVGTGKPLPSGYPLGAVLWYPAGGYFVRSLVADNTESDLTDTTKWAKITISAAELAAEATARSNADASKANISADNISAAGQARLHRMLMPDYSAGISLTAGTDTAITEPGYVYICGASHSGTDSRVVLTINGADFIANGVGYVGNYRHTPFSSLFMPVDTGDVVNTSHTYGNETIVSYVFYPLRAI